MITVLVMVVDLVASVVAALEERKAAFASDSRVPRILQSTPRIGIQRCRRYLFYRREKRAPASQADAALVAVVVVAAAWLSFRRNSRKYWDQQNRTLMRHSWIDQPFPLTQMIRRKLLPLISNAIVMMFMTTIMIVMFMVKLKLKLKFFISML